MQNPFLQENFQKDRFKFYQQQLFDEARPLKKYIAVIGLIMLIYDVSQELFFLPREVINQHPSNIAQAILGVMSITFYSISIFKFFEKKNYKVFKIRFLLVLCAIICFSVSMGIKGYYEIIARVSSNDPEKWYYYFLRSRYEVWLTLLVDLLIPFWYLKLICPSVYWIVEVIAYYKCGLEHTGMVWSCFIFSTLFTASLWGLKDYYNWKIFLSRLKAETWDGVHRYILDKVPDAIAIINPNHKIIYSNASFKLLCGDDLETLDKQLSNISNIQKLNVDTVPNYETEQNKKNLSERRYLNRFQNEDSEVPITFFEILQTIIEPLVDGMTKFDNYSIFSANICPNHSKDMTPHSYEIKISPLLEHGKVILILSDTTQRDLVVSLETVNQYKDKLLATVSHDLRAPINGSLTFIESSIQHETVPTFIKDQFLIPAQRSCKFLLHLVNDILDFSQINAQKLRMNFEALSLVDTIKNCYQLLEMQANYKKIDLSLDLDEKLPLLFTTDHNRLSQIIINLLSNAIKFTFKGGITLSAKVINNEKFSSSSNLVEIKVKDTGIGIKEKDLTNLFQEFTRIEYEQININNRGIGLGLVIANKLAKKLGPKGLNQGINVSSVYGEGSTFGFLLENFKQRSLRSINLENCSIDNRNQSNSRAVSLLLKDEDFCSSKIDEVCLLNFKSPHNLPYTNDVFPNFQRPKLKPLCNPEKAFQSTCKVLIVDDNPLNIMALEILLKQYSIGIDSCYNGKEAVDKLTQNYSLNKTKTTNYSSNNQRELFQNYQLIFMDCEMPIMDGFEAAQTLTSMMQKGEINTIPIIGCTAHEEPDIISKCFENGMTAVVGKPPQHSILAELLRKYVQ